MALEMRVTLEAGEDSSPGGEIALAESGGGQDESAVAPSNRAPSTAPAFGSRFAHRQG